MSVFSDFLLYRVNFGRIDQTSITKLDVALKQYDVFAPEVILFGHTYSVNLDKSLEQEDVQKVIRWICHNIIRTISVDNYVTRGVKIRIATGMINKLSVDDNTKLLIHDNFVQNVYQLVADIQGLPF